MRLRLRCCCRGTHCPTIDQHARPARRLALSAGSVQSRAHPPGAACGQRHAFYASNDVPHGRVAMVQYKTSAGVEKRLHIYLPPGYDADTGRGVERGQFSLYRQQAVDMKEWKGVCPDRCVCSFHEVSKAPHNLVAPGVVVRRANRGLGGERNAKGSKVHHQELVELVLPSQAGTARSGRFRPRPVTSFQKWDRGTVLGSGRMLRRMPLWGAMAEGH